MNPPYELIGEPQDKRQSNSEPSHVLVAEMSNLLSDPVASDGNRLVGHHLRFEPQSVFGSRFNANAKIGGVHQIGSQLADHHRGMVLRKGVRLDDDGRTGLAGVTRRGDDHHITALHLHQIRRLSRSIATLPARGQRRDRQPASQFVVSLPASGRRQPRDAARADVVRAFAAASFSSFRRAASFGSPSSVTRYSVTRYKPERKG